MIRTIIFLCSVSAVALPGILLYGYDNGEYRRPASKQQYINYPARRYGLGFDKAVPRESLINKGTGRNRGPGRSLLQPYREVKGGYFILPGIDERVGLGNSSSFAKLTPKPLATLPRVEKHHKRSFSEGNPRANVPKASLMDEAKPYDVEIGKIHASHETHSGACKEVLKVAFLKTHKTGSTTVMNVIQRFGHVRNLVFALPRSTNYLGFGETVTPNALLPAPKGQSYDLLINHVVYNRYAFRQIMPKETVYVTIIRHPLEQFVSAVEYLKGKLGYLKKLPQNNSASEFLRNPSYYETKDYKWSFTNNRMSFDLGLDHTMYHDDIKVKQFIRDIDEDFKLVMITEYMDKSLLLLKKYLCWSYRDILYIPRNVNARKLRYNFTLDEQRAHRAWAQADYKLYDYFLVKFKKLVDTEGEQFLHELHVFKMMLLSVRKFCISGKYRHSWLKINKTKWNEEFEVTGKDCEYMLLDEVPFLQRTRTQFIRKLRRYGTSPWIVHRFNPLNVRRPMIVRRSIMRQKPVLNRRKYRPSFNRARLRRPR